MLFRSQTTAKQVISARRKNYKMKYARAKRAKLLSFIVKDANLRRSCRSRCHGYFSSLFFKDMADDDNDDDDDNNNVLRVDVVDHNDKKWDT